MNARKHPLAALTLLLPAAVVLAAALPGAIFTTTPDGTIVNENVRYERKIEVYLDGGPGPNAPQTAAGLPDGDYVFQVTDPSGKVLLSEDASKCRVFRVEYGVIVALRDLSFGSGNENGNIVIADHVVSDACHVDDEPEGAAGASGKHDTNVDFDHGPPAIVVQLMPFFDTPNPGGVYKAWAMPLGRYVANGGDLQALPKAYKVRGVKVGYQRDPGFGPPRDQVKTDNFKVKEFFPPEIKVRKFHDLDGDGVWDGGEPEIGVAQCVVPETGEIEFCPPDGGGGWPYEFTEPVDGGTVTNDFYTPFTHVAGLAGTYTACEDSLPGWTQSAAYVDGVKLDADRCVSVSALGTSPGEKHEIVFGNFRNATKSGMKFEDVNGNGQKDSAEPGLSGWTIKLDGTDGMGSAVHTTATTGADGGYSFSVPPGSYKVCEDLKPGWTQSYPSAGCYDVTLASGDVHGGNDFGNFKNATKSGVKFHDLNGNGVKDAEPGLPGWTITLKGTDGRGNAVDTSTTTGAGGAYSFSVPPGSYKVCEVLQEGWTQSLPAGDGCYQITLVSQQVDNDNDFGNFRNATKSGYKFGDTNGNHLRDAGEGGLSGWVITLVGTDGQGNAVSQTATTDSTGKYSFSVPPGSYKVCETPQSGWVQTFPTSGFACANGTTGYAITLTSGQTDSDNDFGNRPNQGCTPGYWKVPQHWDSWPAPWFPGAALSAMFGGVSSEPYASHEARWDQASVLMGLATQVQALSFQGGDTVPEKAEILLRAAVAAVLNADSSAVQYPWTAAQVVSAVNAALASQDPGAILTLAVQLDRDNNGPGGCPLN